MTRAERKLNFHHSSKVKEKAKSPTVIRHASDQPTIQ